MTKEEIKDTINAMLDSQEILEIETKLRLPVGKYVEAECQRQRYIGRREAFEITLSLLEELKE